MALTTYYVTTTNPQVTVPIAAYHVSRYYWREPKIYRDLFQPLKQGTIGNLGGTGQLNTVADVPVVGVEGTTYESGGAVATMTVKAASPDNMTHTPHRCDWIARSGYAFALTDVALPDPPLLQAASACTFNGASATDILTQATGSWWPQTGDIVTVGTAGNGLTTTALYTFVRISTTTGKLTLAGSIVDISGTITGVTLALVTASTLPDAVPEVVYFPDPVLVSTGEPV